MEVNKNWNLFWKVELHKFVINLFIIEVNNVIQFCFVLLSTFDFSSLFKIMFFLLLFCTTYLHMQLNQLHFIFNKLKSYWRICLVDKNVVIKRWWWLISKRKTDWLPNSIMECQCPQTSISLHLLTLNNHPPPQHPQQRVWKPKHLLHAI